MNDEGEWASFLRDCRALPLLELQPANDKKAPYHERNCGDADNKVMDNSSEEHVPL